MTERGVMLDSWTRLFVRDRITSASDGPISQNVFARPLRDSLSRGRSDFERDYCRIVYASQFRRLANKTQVLPDSGIDHVRNRLTHSIEVSTVASSIFREYERRLEKHRGLKIAQASDAHWVLRTAGLAHDLGNPPYGHAGEKAIRKWAVNFFASHQQYRVLARDFKFFDGNAQSFRLLSRDDLGFCDGIVLTLTSLAAIVKYPYSVCDKRAEGGKFNAFKTENDILDLVMDRHGLKCEGDYYRRHPLSFFLEAADDVSYILSDMEDAVYAGIITDEEKNRLFTELAYPEIKGRTLSTSRQAIQSAVASILVNGYARAFYDSQRDIFTNRFFSGHDLENALPKEIRDWLPEVKALRDKIIEDGHVRDAETHGAKMISHVLDVLVRVLPFVGPGSKTPTTRIRQIIENSFGLGFFEKNKRKQDIWWLHVILDYVSGMTDGFLETLAAKLK